MNIDETTYKVIFIVYTLLLGFLRLLQHLKYRKEKTPLFKVSKSEYVTFVLAFLGMLIIPLIHISTGWLEMFRMNLPDWARLSGPVIGVFGLILLWWVHQTLGSHWAPIPEIEKDHELLMDGPYKYIRHPMYSAFYVFTLGAWLTLSNWLVGIAGFVAWTIFCRVRITIEEEMMLKEFGSEYQDYMKRAGSLLPKLSRPIRTK
ncbi:MAG: protein-S-isoprenylcysteine O-methyltransferase [Candidatus Omnitrophota bacterium]